MKKETKQWFEIAADDYDLGSYATERGLYPQALYMFCQAIEKSLKAAQIEFNHEVPKKIHHLDILATSSKLPFNQEQYKSLKKLTEMYDRVRYPDLSRTRYNTKAKTKEIINQAQTIYLWIQQQFKHNSKNS